VQCSINPYFAHPLFPQYGLQIPEKHCFQLSDCFFLRFGFAGYRGTEERFEQLYRGDCGAVDFCSTRTGAAGLEKACEALLDVLV
jgi:hypothetical protein